MAESGTAYLAELRAHWRPLTASFLGLSVGFSTTSYVVSIMAPHFIAEFGWSKADFAMVGSLGLLAVLFFPFVGRAADRFGVRRTALVGVVVTPLVYVALSRMNGDIRTYIALYLVQTTLCLTTTTTVYSRTVVRHIRRARGLALAIVASGPACSGAVIAPLINIFVENHGWRTGYLVIAAGIAIVGGVSLLLLPSDRSVPTPSPALEESRTIPAPRRAKADYTKVLRNPAFWVLSGSMLLCNLPQVVGLTQLNLILLANGATPLAISAMISAFASGTLLGRFACGLALDRLPAHWVAATGMALSSIGLFLLASSFDGGMVLTLSILLVGLSFGAEGDLLAFLIVRYFGVTMFSSVMGIMTAVISITVAGGAILLGLMLKAYGGYDAFLSLCGVTVLAGAGLFFLLPATRPEEAI